MSSFFTETLSHLDPYVPGEQPKDKKFIKLNTNENPYPPSPAVGIALCEDPDLNLYSDPEAARLTGAIADFLGVKSENVLCANGSDEILAFAFRAFCGGKVGAAFADVTYGFYKVFASLFSIDAKIIPLDSDFKIDPSDYLILGRTIFIANPNAPTGHLLALSDIEKIVSGNKENVVVIDEAYIDFGGESAVALIDKYKNLLVVRTFSKSRSLAGARLGFAVGDGGLIADLKRVKYSFNPYNVNTLTQRCGIAAIEDRDYFESCVKKIIDVREKTFAALKKQGHTVLDSKANFLFVKHKSLSGKDYYDKLRARGILVRHFDSPRTAPFVRVTIGTAVDMEKFIALTEELV